MKNKFSPDEKKLLREIQARFLERMRSLPEKHQRSHVMVNAAKGDGEVDPLYRALAKQTHEAFQLQDRIKEAQAELAAIGTPDPTIHKPRNPNWRAQALERKEDLQRQITADQARLVGLQEQDFSHHAQRALELHRQRETQRYRNEQFKEAMAEAQAEADAEAMRRRARALVKGSRRAGDINMGGIEEDE